MVRPAHISINLFAHQLTAVHLGRMTLARTGKRGARRRSRSSTSKFRRLAPERLEDRWLLAATNILTYLGDLAGTGGNTNESTLTPANVNSTQFGKQFTSSVDGQVFAQPLYMTGVNITTGTNQG